MEARSNGTQLLLSSGCTISQSKVGKLPGFRNRLRSDFAIVCAQLVVTPPFGTIIVATRPSLIPKGERGKERGRERVKMRETRDTKSSITNLKNGRDFVHFHISSDNAFPILLHITRQTFTYTRNSFSHLIIQYIERNAILNMNNKVKDILEWRNIRFVGLHP